MQQQNIRIGTLVGIYKCGELRLPENQRYSVWRAIGFASCLLPSHTKVSQRCSE